MTTQEIQSVPAIWEDGVLRPLLPLALPEHARVHITVAVTEEALLPDREQIQAALALAGLSLVEPVTYGLKPLSPEARAALAREVPPGRPLSLIIDEEREGL